MSDDIPYKTEYAKSNRASCKLCKSNIGKDSLRVAKMVQSRHFDGKVPNWFHYSCFFKKFKANSLADFGGIDALRWEDQEKIKGNITGGGGGGGGGSAKRGATAAAAPSLESEDLKAEYAKSSRSSCKDCKEQIGKGELRLAKVIDSGEGYGPAPWWHHVECFVKSRDSLDVDATVGAENFSGFKQLEKDDQKMLKGKLGTCGKSSGAGSKGKKKKVEEPTKQKSAEEIKEEEALKEQSKLVWKIRDGLSSSCPLSSLKEMLEDNDMTTSGGETSVLNRCADGLAFGKLLPCEECKGGMLVYRDDSYHCTGNLSGWTKCTFTTQDPKRGDWIISDELKEEVDFLNKFKFKKRKRLFPKLTAVVSTNGSAVPPPGKPLFNMKFAVIGKLKLTKAAMTSSITELGGSVTNTVNATVTCCISSEVEVTKRSKKMLDAEKHDVPVVSEDFLEAVKKGGAMLMISQYSIVPWGKNKGVSAVDGPPPPSVSRKTPSSRFEKGGSGAKKIKLSVKGGAAVDPDSGKEHSCHVLEVLGVVYNAILGMVDIVRGTNSYYKLQVLEKDSGSKCYLFRSWGRVGTTIGGNKLEDFGSKDEAIEKFKELYAEKTGNDWSKRNNFIKHPNRFYPLEIDYGQDEEDLKKAGIAPGSQTKLPVQLQELIKMIFDVESMKKTMVEYEIDLKKMPLGKLTRRQIERAYSALGEAQQILNDGGNNNLILDVSNRFYTLIPHDFGMRKPPMLDNLELIKTKIGMLDNLLDIEVAYSLLKSAGGDQAKDPLDVNYEKLNTKMEVLEHESAEFKMISEYVSNTHASTHRQFELELIDVFKVERHGEAAQYKPFKQLHNRQLLWHGSRKTNYAGILSQGLRIAPPEAPVTGYMFGKGVYFADMVSKSANYCCTSPSNDIGLLMLCEVALGNMHELTAANFITKLPKGKHSVKGIGKTAPDPKETHVMEDGTIVPKGKGTTVDSQMKSSLLYNEYIVYDVSQINIKYLLKTKFKYKYGW